MRFLERFGNDSHDRAMRLLTAILASIGISAVYVSAPTIQAGMTVLISGDSSALYEGLNSKGIGGVGQISDQLAGAFYPPLLAIGLITALAMAASNTKREFLWAGTLACAVCWTVSDLFAVPYSAGELAVCLFSNVVGGLLLTIFAYVAVSNFKPIGLIVGNNSRLKKILWVIWPFTSYLVLALALFIILRFLINIPTTQVSFKVEPPVRGSYTLHALTDCAHASVENEDAVRGGQVPKCAHLTASGGGKSEDQVFGILEGLEAKDSGKLEWVGKASDLDFKWSKRIEEPVIAQLRIVQGCRFPADSDSALAMDSFLEGPVSQIEILGDAGMSEFRPFSSQAVGEVTINDADLANFSQFWLGPSDDDPKTLTAHRFLGKGKLEIEERLHRINYEIGMFVFNADDSDSGADRRALTLRLDGNNQGKLIRIKNEQTAVKQGATLSCKPVKVEEVADGYVATIASPYASVLVSIIPPNEFSYKSFVRSNHLVVSGLNGWMASGGWEPTALTDLIQTGRVGQMSVFGVFKDAQIGDNVLVTSGSGTLGISGDLQVRTDGSALLVSGNASLAVVNDHRVTTTRWERLEAGLRVAILVGVPTVFYFLLRLAVSTLRRPIRKVWKMPN